MNIKSKMLMMAYAYAAMGSINGYDHYENKSYPTDLQTLKLKEPLTKIGHGKNKFIFNDEKFGDITVMADNQKSAYKKYKLLLGINRENGFYSLTDKISVVK